MKSTELLIDELLLLEQIHRARGEVDTADVLRASADRLHDLNAIAEFYRMRIGPIVINLKRKRKK